MTRVRVGLVGAGRMAQSHARHLAEAVELADFAAIADIAEARAQSLASRFGVPVIHDRLAGLLADASILAVIIATPTDTHVELIEAAAAAGKHVLCEKPLALTVAGCDRAIAAARRGGVNLQVGFQRRFDPAYLRAVELVRAGVIGRPVIFKAMSRDPERTSLEFARRQSSGGLIMDMSIHDFDLARWFMGAEVERVYAEGGCLVYPELSEVDDIDNVVVSMRFDNGSLADIDASRNAVYGPDVRMEILGAEGGLAVGLESGVPVVTVQRRGESVQESPLPVQASRFSAAYAAEIRAFLRAVRDGGPPPLPASEARAATAIAVAATVSLDEGRVVRLEEVS